VLGTTATREQTERRLKLPKDRGLPCCEAHVARQHKLATSGADTTLDLRNRDEPACTEMVKHDGKRRLAS